MEAVAEPWQAEVVRPLRALRRRLKGGFPPLPPERIENYRKGFSELEIEGEHIAQEAMEVALPQSAAGSANAALTAANLKAYFAHEAKEIGDKESLRPDHDPPRLPSGREGDILLPVEVTNRR